jgi:hypothetical protein
MTLIFLGLFGGLFHLANSQVRAFEISAASDISSKLQGEGRQVSVRAEVGPEVVWGDVHSVRIDATHFSTSGLPLYTESKRSHRGLVRQLHLDLRDFSLRNLHIERLSADIPNCRFDFPLAVDHRKIRLSQSGTGIGEVVIGEKDLEKFILSKFSEVKQVSVKIDKDKVFVEGFGEFLIVQTNFSVVARLDAQDGDKLVLTHSRILFDGQIADEAAKQAILGTLNPVVDLNQDLSLFGAIQVERIVLRDGLLMASGPIRIPELPHEK